MKSESFKLLKSKINILNDLNDKINLIEWNKDDGPKFESVEEMKDFEEKVINGDFEFVLDDNTDTDNNTILKAYKTTKDNYFFYIYSYKNNDKYITYLSLKNLDETDCIHNIYGYKTDDENSALTYFDKLKNDISNNTIDYILNKMIIDVDKNINNLKNKYEKLTSES